MLHCDQIWRYFTTLAKILKAMDNFDRVYFVFGKTLNLLWQLNDAFGQLFMVSNGQILKILSSHLVTQVRETFARKTLRLKRERE